MRTTVSLADDVVAAIEQHRHARAIGMSQAVNELIRTAVAAPAPAEPFTQTTHELGTGVDVMNVAELLETLDGPKSA